MSHKNIKIDEINTKRISTIESIVKEGLCVRCGGCWAVCPYDNIISFNGSYYPIVDFEKCIKCGLCKKVCPANEIDIPKLYEQIFGFKSLLNHNGMGFFLDVNIAHSTSKKVRNRASSGGFVTQLLCYLLETKKIDAAIVVSNHIDPLNPIPILTSSPEDIRSSTGSKYTIVPVNSKLRDLKKFSGKIAFVGLPCHIHSLRMWDLLSPKMGDKTALIIGLFCHNNLEKEALFHMIKMAGITPEEIVSIDFRGGRWPGGVRIMLKDGKWQCLHGLTHKEAFNYLSKVYCPQACRNCVDFCSELADISIGDPWLRGPDGEFLFKDSWSLVVTRTERGMKYIEETRQSGEIIFKKIPASLFEINFSAAARSKTRLAQWRVSKLRKRGRRYPVNHLKIPRFGLRENLLNKIDSFFKELLKIGPIRNLYLRFTFSKYGERFSLFKERVKKKRFSLKNKHRWLEPEIKSNL